MLSYQHIYHAGGPADLHKHSILCAALDVLRRRARALAYMETHAGRGLYDLRAPESEKTGEAKQGWLAPGMAERVPAQLLDIVKKLNDGAAAPLYPGSPLIAAHMLRPQDSLHLFELHPQEHAALIEAVKNDARVHIYKQDGYQGVVSLCPPMPRNGMVLIDPSFEIKEEYDLVPDFITRLRRAWPEAQVLLWYPLLPAARHEEMKKAISRAHKGAAVHEYLWAAPDQGPGMYGSGMISLNAPAALPGFSGL